MDLAFLGFIPGTRFASPAFLLLLIALSIFIVLYVFRQTRSAVGVTFSATGEAAKIRPSFWVRVRHLPALLEWIAFAALVIALARPQYVRYESMEEVLEYGADIMLVMDSSGSMQALDFQPNNRLYVAQQVVKDFIKDRSSDQIGLVAFAGTAATTCPLTTNMAFLESKIDELDFGLLEDRTAIGTALSTALNRMQDSKSKSKVIILLTDGVNNAGEVLPIDAATIAMKMKVKVYTIGVGSTGPVPIPTDTGRVVMGEVGLDEALLKQIASITGGVYRKATDPESLKKVYEEISELEKTQMKAKIYRYPLETEYFQFFLYPGLGLLVIGLILRWTRLGVLP